MNYQETLDYLFSRLASYQHQGATALNYKLDNIVKFCAYLGNPHLAFKTIHVGGTNGKGTTSHMLSAILQTHGYNVGLYTSPHLKRMNERFKINGQEIDNQFIVDFVGKHRAYINQEKLSFFELTVGLAFDFFKQKRVDYAVIEVGLGGRFDSTNIITPLLSVITNVSYDHVAVLGNSLTEIAFEKAGIIKSGVPVVIGEVDDEEVKHVFLKKADEVNAPIFFADQSETFRESSNFVSYEYKNYCTVKRAVQVLEEIGVVWDNEKTALALREYKKRTGLNGRWQKLTENPSVYCDVGHNEAGVREIVNQINRENYNSLHVVWGMVSDKDVAKVVSLLPEKANYYLCQSLNARAMPVNELAGYFTKAGLKYEIVPLVNDALKLARKNASKDDLIFVGGSTFVVGELEEI